jgi:hypothetical protein
MRAAAHMAERRPVPDTANAGRSNLEDFIVGQPLQLAP